MIDDWFGNIGAQVWDFVGALRDEVRSQGLLPLFRPVSPFNHPGFLAPAVTVAGLVSLVLLSGVAVTAFGSFLLALLMMYLLMAQVFGISLELHPLGATR